MTSNEEPLDLAAIRARVDAATEGPWRANGNGEVWKMSPSNKRWGRTPEIDIGGGNSGEGGGYYMDAGDAEFIAHARTDVPALLDALATAQADLAARDAALLALAERAEKPEERQHALQLSEEYLDGFDEAKSAVAEGIRKILAQSPADALDADPAKIACPHWSPGSITMRKGCTACEAFRPGDRVRFNALGVSLFGGAEQTGLVVSMAGTTAQVAWESGQDTTATINTLERVPEDRTTPTEGATP